MKKIFISSVMRDFSAERKAARAAVESLRQKAVMAEDFGAKPFSSEIACMEGVRQSDIYVGIMGPRYGYVTEAGISVTEAEFNEALRRGVPVLWFVQKTDLEAQQKKLLDRIGAFKDGYFVDFFQSPQELQTKVTGSLYDYIGQPDVSSLDVTGAAQHAAKYVNTRRHLQEYTTYLQAIIFPSRQGEDFLSPLDLERGDFQDRIIQRAMFGTGAVFRRNLGTDTVEGSKHIAFEQCGLHQRLANAIEVHCDGTLVLTTALGAGESRDVANSAVASFIVDQDETGQRLAAFLSFAAAFFGELEASALLSSFYLAVLFRNMTFKSFGRRPHGVTNTLSIPTPFDAGPDPMMIPTQPIKVARAELASGQPFANKVIALIERTFRTQNRYFGGR